jgi:Flp pilus assembly protein TadG
MPLWKDHAILGLVLRKEGQGMGIGRKQRGAVIVESALTIGVLLLLLFAIMDLARAYNIYQVLTNAAREGARYSVAPDPNNAYAVPSVVQIQNDVQQFMASDHVRGTTVNVYCVYASGTPAPNLAICPQSATQVADPTLQTDANLNPVYTKVEVTIPYKFMILPLTVNISSKAVMRNEDN